MKKIFSLLLTVVLVMSIATIATCSVSAAENSDVTVGAADTAESAGASDNGTQVGAGSDVSESGTSGKVYFEKPAKWAGTIVYCHIFEATGDMQAFFGWQTKKEKCTEENGKWVYDLSTLEASTYLSGGLKSGTDYDIMFSDNSGNEACPLMFNTNVVGDTYKVTDTDSPSYENSEDSTKKQWKGAWTENAKKYGIPLTITSVGTVQGEFIAKDNTISKIISHWDESYPAYPSSQSYSSQSSARDHKTRLAELKTELSKMAANGEIYYIGGGTYSETSSSSSSSNGSSSSSSSSSSSNSSSSSSSTTASSYKTADGKTVTKKADGTFVDEDGNVVEASDVVETTGTVSTGESSTYVFVTLGVMLAAAGVYFLTRKRKA